MSSLPGISVSDVESACNILLETRQYDRLGRLLWSLPRTTQFTDNDPILVTRCALCFHQRRYTELYSTLRARHFDRRHHQTLQNLWFEAHYDEAELRRGGKSLGPVGKYRVRRKYPPPATICEGPQPSFCFDERVRETLAAAYSRSQYPTAQQKHELATITNLTTIQVSNWFKNKRQRSRGHQEDTTGGITRSTSSSPETTPSWLVRGSDCSSPSTIATDSSSDGMEQYPVYAPHVQPLSSTTVLPNGLVMWHPQHYVPQSQEQCQ